jgi:hypothetical protein
MPVVNLGAVNAWGLFSKVSTLVLLQARIY